MTFDLVMYRTKLRINLNSIHVNSYFAELQVLCKRETLELIIKNKKKKFCLEK